MTMSRIARWGQAALHTLPRQQISLAAPAQPSRRCYSNDYDGQDDGSGPSTSSFQSPESQHPRSDRHQNRGPSTSIAPPPDGYDLLLSQFEAGSALAKPTHSNEELNLSLLRKLRPLPGKQRKHFRGERLREKAQMEEKLWQKSIERVSNAFGLPQVRKLAREAGLEGQIVRGKKQIIVAALVEKVFGYKPPRTLESTAAGRSGSYDQAIGQLSSASHEVSQTDLFLLLADGGAKLNQLAGTFGTRLTPRVSTDEEGRNVYSIEARGDEQQVGAPIEKALQSVSEVSRRVAVRILRLESLIIPGHPTLRSSKSYNASLCNSHERPSTPRQYATLPLVQAASSNTPPHPPAPMPTRTRPLWTSGPSAPPRTLTRASASLLSRLTSIKGLDRF